MAIPNSYSSNSSKAFLMYPSVKITSESKKSKNSPWATSAPLFLPTEGIPPFTILHPYFFAISRVLSFDPASATITS